jgi:predicted DsbA family dithiol-disulfide isomerase
VRRFGAQIEWYPFDLHPEYPAEGITRASLAERYGPGLENHTRQLIEGAGFHYQPSARVPRALPALRLAEFARAEGRHGDIHPRLFAAYWSEGRDIGDIDVLVDVAEATGLDGDKAREVLSSDAYGDSVRESTAAAVRLGVNGVPAWVIDEKGLVPGAQPHDIFDRVLRQLGYSPLEDQQP